MLEFWFVANRVYKFVIELKCVCHNLRITWISRNTLLSVVKDAHLNNCSKAAQCTQKYLLNCFSLSVVLFFENSSSKASVLLFIFARVSMGHAHFSN